MEPQKNMRIIIAKVIESHIPILGIRKAIAPKITITHQKNTTGFPAFQNMQPAGYITVTRVKERYIIVNDSMDKFL